jgi:flagellar basal-body rod modification protein FlgD
MDTGLSRTYNKIIGRAESDFAKKAPKTGDKSELDRNAFLRLLTTQLAHQDPLKPMDDQQFVAQLAQFSSLEQLQNIAETIGKFKENFARQEMQNAVGFIGKQIRARGKNISKHGDFISSFSYELQDVAKRLHLNIFDPNGNLVRSITLPGRMPGQHEFIWDGRDHSGNKLPDGVYSIFIAAEGKHGKPLQVNTKTSGLVLGVVNHENQVFLQLQDGRRINFQDVQEVLGSTSS